MFSPFNNQTYEELWIYCVQTKYLVTYTDIYEKERQQQQSELLLAKFEQSLHNHCTVVNICSQFDSYRYILLIDVFILLHISHVSYSGKKILQIEMINKFFKCLGLSVSFKSKSRKKNKTRRMHDIY